MYKAFIVEERGERSEEKEARSCTLLMGLKR